MTFPAYETTTLSARDAINAARGEERKDYSADDRKAAAKSGAAMPDGSFPISDAEDLANAIHLAGNAKDPAAARRHIMARARALGLESKIPDTWNSDGTVSEANNADWYAEFRASLENRDEQDGDDPYAEFYEILSNGAAETLKANTGQIPTNIAEALQIVLAFYNAQVAHASGDEGHGSVSEGGDGALTYQENDAYDVELMSMRVAYLETLKRAEY